MRLLRRVGARASTDDGALLVMTVMLMPVVLAFMGIMLDGALILSSRRELQDAADAAALTGAMQIDLQHFADTGEWRIADQSNLSGQETAHEAAEEVCAIYRVTCFTDVPVGSGGRTFHVIAQSERRTVFMHLMTSTPVMELRAEATALMAPGF